MSISISKGKFTDCDIKRRHVKKDGLVYETTQVFARYHIINARGQEETMVEPKMPKTFGYLYILNPKKLSEVFGL